jgi:hypothetical protein
MKAPAPQRDLIARLRETGHGPGLIAGTMGVQWQTAVRIWHGKVKMTEPMEEWLTRYAAWMARNRPPPPPAKDEGDEGGDGPWIG